MAAQQQAAFLSCTATRESPGRGRGVFVTLQARKGADAFTETPYAAAQTLASRERAPACTHCLCPLGPLAAHATAATHAGDPRRVRAAALGAALAGASADAGAAPLPGQLPPLSGHAAPPRTAVPCPHACGEVFCSAACRDAAWRGWHHLLCDGQVAGDAHPLKEFRKHAASTHEIFLLGARALATALAAAQAAGGTPEAAQRAAQPLQARVPCAAPQIGSHVYCQLR
jgi:hypothetical protein